MTKRKKSDRQKAIDRCDKLCGNIVRSVGKCESGRTEHSGALQWCHGFSRSYHAVRWDPRNSWAMCQGCHFYFTIRPLEWDQWMLDKLGDEYQPLRQLALTHVFPDLDVTEAELRALWSTIEAAA